MSRDDVRAALFELFEQTTNRPVTGVSDTDSLNQILQVDSFTFLGLIMEIEKRFDIALNLDELRGINTIGDLLDRILSKRAGA
jgi:acyl carrier protein